jgi:hypothetical protein
MTVTPWFSRGLATVIVAATVAGCSGAGAPAGSPVADPDAAAAELQTATRPGAPLQVTFAWSLDEAGSRLRGRGVARLEAPERIRLDLFGPRGETYLAAALVGDTFHLPAAVPAEQVVLPPPALLWAAVGVVRPSTDSRLLDAATANGQLVLRYSERNGETVEYVADMEPLRLVRATRDAPGAQRETLILGFGADGELSTARYRNLGAYRELVLEIEAMDEVSPFPSSIWRPDVASR